MVNSNPETVSTDYDTCDRLYFEPLTLEDVLNIYEREKCWGVIVQLGGQTPLNLARELERHGVNVIGTPPASIEAAEDREFFNALVGRLNMRQPESGIAHSAEEAAEIAGRIGYPVLVRPSFVLGGRAMAVVGDEESLGKYMVEAVRVSRKRPILIDRFLEAAVEVDVDCVSDGTNSIVGAIMEHVEHAGVHSGDSACFIPPVTLAPEMQKRISDHTLAMARELGVVGLMNVQYAVKDNEVYVLEVNPRASRTVPFVSKAVGAPLAKVAARAMVGVSLPQQGFAGGMRPSHFATKEVVLPFIRFQGTDIILKPEMRSTGEVMGVDADAGIAYLKSQLAAGSPLPEVGAVFISVCDRDKSAIVPFAKQLADMGYKFYATLGTATLLRNRGIKANALFRISEGRPNALDMLHENEIAWVVNTPTGTLPWMDEVKMRQEALFRGVPITTTVNGFRAAVNGLAARRRRQSMNVRSLQELHGMDH